MANGSTNLPLACIGPANVQRTILRVALAILFFSSIVTTVSAQNVSATWPLTTNLSPVVSGNAIAASMTVGAGVNAGNYASGSYAVKAIDATTLAAAQANNEYIQFALAPAANYVLTISSIQLTAAVSRTATPNNAGFQVLYSTGTTFLPLGNPGTPTTTAASTSIQNLSIPVAAGQTLYLRIYIWGVQNTSSTEFRIKDVTLSATACPAVAAISYPKAAYCKDPNTTAAPTITGVTGGSFSAAPAGLSINSLTGIVDVTNSTAGTYTVSYTVAASGCVDLVATTTLKINDLPTAFSLTGPDGATAQFCTNGTPATFTLSSSQSGVTYTFISTNPGGNNPPGQNYSLPGGGTLEFVQTPDGKWSYSVKGTDDLTGCSNTMIGTLTAVNGPSVTSQPESVKSVCVGTALTLTVNLHNAKSLAWQMSKDGGATWISVPGSSPYSLYYAANNTTTTLTISSVSADMNGYMYKVLYGGPAACPANYSTGTKLSVSDVPSFTVQPQSKTVCNNSSLALLVSANNATAYQWYKGTTAIPNATSATYSTTFNSATDAGTYYVIATGSCGAKQSGNAVITANTNPTSTTWQGPTAGTTATGSAWEQESNWSCGVPTSTVDAVIPADIIDGYPTVGATVNGEVRNLTLTGGAFGAFLTVNGKMAIYGSLVNNGGVFDAANGTIEFRGTTTQVIPANFFSGNTVKNLIISNNVNLAGELNLTGTLSFGNVNSKTFASAGYFTLKANASATARIADLTNNAVNSGNAISGNVTVESYMPSHRRYRLVTNPVKDATINSTWQEGRTWNGLGAEPAQTGTLITGASQGNVANANNNGFDFWSATSGASVFRYAGSLNTSSNLGATWTPVTNTRQAGFNNQEAYLLFVRGDRTVTTGTGSTTLKGKGSLKEEPSVLLTVPGQSHVLVGNPFVSPLNFKSLYADNANVIEPYYWIWQATLGTGTGGYVLVQPNGSGGYEAIPSGTTVGATTDPVIGTGEGFFVVPKQGAVLPGTLVIQQKHKSSGTPLVNAFRTAGQALPKLRINVLAAGNGEKNLLDGVMARFDGSFANAGYAIAKAPNSGENLSIQRNGRDLIVASSGLPKEGDTLRLRLWNLTAREYSLELKAAQFAGTGLSAVLYDKYLRKEMPVDLRDQAQFFNFSVTADAASKDPLRFSVIFRSNTSLPLQLGSAAATQVGRDVWISWRMENESGVQDYRVEKSADGTTFQVLTDRTAGKTAAPASYTAVDDKPFAMGYYRVRIKGTNGETQYSQLLKVQMRNGAETMAVFPNPVSGGSFTLQLLNKPRGAYTLSLYNVAGLKVMRKLVQHGGGTVLETISIPGTVTAGNYVLELADPANRKEVIKLTISKN